MLFKVLVFGTSTAMDCAIRIGPLEAEVAAEEGR